MYSLVLVLVLAAGDLVAAEPNDKPAEPPAKATRPTASARYKVKSADLVALPSEPGLLVGVVRSDIAGGWLVLADGFEPVAADVADDQRSVVFEGKPGRYAVLFFPPGSITQPQLQRVDLGNPTPPAPPKPSPPKPTPPVDNPYPAPDTSTREKLAPVMTISTERADATKLAAMYGRAAELIETGLAARAAGVKPETGTPAELRAWLIENGRPLGLAGKYPGLADAVDKALADLLGLDAGRQLTQTDADGFESLAWAIFEGGTK